MSHRDYPRLSSMILGYNVAMGTGGALCDACDFVCNINTAEEISVYDYESVEKLSRKESKGTSFFLVCERCKFNHNIQASINGKPYPFKPSA